MPCFQGVRQAEIAPVHATKPFLKVQDQDDDVELEEGLTAAEGSGLNATLSALYATPGTVKANSRIRGSIPGRDEGARHSFVSLST